MALIQESLAVAHKTGALAPRDLERVVVDTTVQPKAIAHPTDARLCHRALAKLVELAKRDVPLRQVSVLGGGGNSRVSARRAQCPITWSPARA